MENFSNWFSRCQGNWVSYRRYLTLPGKKDDTYATEFTIAVDGNKVSIKWDGDASSGDMNLTIEGDVLHRDIGYFTDEPNDSQLTRLDIDTVVLLSEYDGMTFREEIRLLDNDTHRLRQTVGYRKGKPFLVGQYWEEKVA
tara:strand:+ start:286 stop:705 length:420 start_codon:yes stop_codon:yes gene_type:complete